MKSLIAAAMRLAVVKSAIAQREPHLVEPVEREVDLALDDRAVGDAADGRHAAHDLGGFALGLEAVDRDRALADRIDVAVGAEQRRDQQRAALQALGVAERRHGDVDARALGAERRQVRRHHDGGHVAGADGLAADVDAEPFQHRLQRLPGERDVVERVAGAVEADDQAVADQLVLAHAFDVGEILDPRRRRHAIGLVRAPKAAARQNKISAATAAANARCNVRITLLPNEFGPHDHYANAVPARRGIKSLKYRGIIFRLAARTRRDRAVHPAKSAGHLPAVNHNGPTLAHIPGRLRRRRLNQGSRDAHRRTERHRSVSQRVGTAPRRVPAASRSTKARHRSPRRRPRRFAPSAASTPARAAGRGRSGRAEAARGQAGRIALDVLDELKVEVLAGTLGPSTLTRLKAATADLRDGSGDPGWTRCWPRSSSGWRSKSPR